MKKNKIIILFSLIILLISSCSKILYVYIKVMEPAPIYVPPKIKTVVVVNRTYVSEEKKSKVVNVLEGALSQQLPYQDQIGGESCVQGLVDQLNQLPRFKAQLATKYKLYGTGTHLFPQAMEWTLVNELCKVYSADAVIALEVFTTDNIHDVKPIRKERNVNGKVEYYTEWEALLGIKLEAGYRIYDPATKIILDQNTFMDQRQWTGSGPNQILAIANCPPQMKMTQDGGYYAGSQYAYKISPKWITVTREMYKRGNDDFKRAGRLCSTGQWDQAAEVCKPYTNDPSPKIAGRACQNMAVVAEVNGDLDGAVSWAQKAYADFGLKKSRYYYNQLLDRQRAEQIVKQQLKE
jgi:hypothetical protein